MIAGGVQRLADVALRLNSYPSIQALTVLGNTDRLGSDGYNDKLSNAHPKTVQADLESLGARSVAAAAQGKGKCDPVTKDCCAGSNREQLIQCLQPDRRVTIEVMGVAKQREHLPRTGLQAVSPFRSADF